MQNSSAEILCEICVDLSLLRKKNKESFLFSPKNGWRRFVLGKPQPPKPVKRPVVV